MNKIYKVVWSKTKNCYVVASEFAKGYCRNKKSATATSGLALSVLVMGALANPAYATIPEGNTGGVKSAVAIGNGSLAKYDDGISIGTGATVGSAANVALGMQAVSAGNHAMALGYQAGATGDETVALGSNSASGGRAALA